MARRRKGRNLSGRSRKALVTFSTGLAIWIGTYLSAKWGALDVVLAGAFHVWLVPNDPPPDPYSPPAHPSDAGQAMWGGLAFGLVCFLLGVLAVKSGVIR